VLLVLGNTNEEVVRISARFPILAFFLSITNINKRPNTRQNLAQSHIKSSVVSLGPYGYVDVIPPSSTSSSGWATSKGILLAHVLTGAGAAAVVYQTVDLGRKAVVSWACWTDWYPILWIGFGTYHHIFSFVCMRLSLGVTEAPSDTSAPSYHAAARSALFVWDLAREPFTVTVLHKRFAHWSKALVDLLNNVNYLYGTAVFSSLTLVSGSNAIKNLAIYGGVAVVGRLVGFWTLENVGGLD